MAELAPKRIDWEKVWGILAIPLLILPIVLTSAEVLAEIVKSKFKRS